MVNFHLQILKKLARTRHNQHYAILHSIQTSCCRLCTQDWCLWDPWLLRGNWCVMSYTTPMYRMHSIISIWMFLAILKGWISWLVSSLKEKYRQFLTKHAGFWKLRIFHYAHTSVSQAEVGRPMGLNARNHEFATCEQQSRRPACGSAQSDQRPCSEKPYIS